MNSIMISSGRLILAVGLIMSAMLYRLDTIQTAVLMGCGLLCLAGVRHRKRMAGLD